MKGTCVTRPWACLAQPGVLMRGPRMRHEDGLHRPLGNAGFHSQPETRMRGLEPQARTPHTALSSSLTTPPEEPLDQLHRAGLPAAMERSRSAPCSK